jgi:hypothetical protein
MKRPILFKAKATDGSGWVVSMTLAKGTIKRKEQNLYMETGHDKWKQVDPNTVCQFIDQYKGKLFWESDRVMHPELGEGVIKYANTGFVVVYADNYTIDLHEDWDELEIIGNLHD